MLSRAEMETIVNFDETGKTCHIYTCSKSVMRKLDKLCDKVPDQYKLVKTDENSKSYVTTKDLIKFRSRKKLSDEQKKVIAERMIASRIKN